jgi:XRE family transcriptional regulator, fatty acid utilization regulator
VLGANVKKARDARGMTQLQLAAAAGLGIATISDLERGQITDPQLSTLEKLAGALGTSVDALLGNAEPATPRGAA